MKTKLLIISLIWVGLSLSHTSNGQQIERYVIGSGGIITASPISTSISLGEPVISTSPAIDIILTQGFQQPAEDQSVDVPIIYPDRTLKIYPNPFFDVLTIEQIGDHKPPLLLKLYNLQGKEILFENHDIPLQHVRQIDLTGIPDGVYLVRVSDFESQSSYLLRIVKQSE